MTLPREVPGVDQRELRRRIYSGEIVMFSKTRASERLTEEVTSLLSSEFGHTLRDPQTALDPNFFARIGTLRRILSSTPYFHTRAFDVAASLGFEPARTALEPFRLRAVLHLGGEIPEAASAYAVHRDIWYGHPQCVITVWLPLFDLEEEETFVFYPELFDQPILPNDSEGFVYALGASTELDRKVARDHKEANRVAVDPERAMGRSLGRELGFACGHAEMLLFSGAQLHRTRPHKSGRTRFSVDCRFVDLDDHQQGLGAPNVDNRCRGSALVDYIRYEHLDVLA